MIDKRKLFIYKKKKKKQMDDNDDDYRSNAILNESFSKLKT